MGNTEPPSVNERSLYMSKDIRTSKSTSDQILELFLENLEKHNEFDESTIQALRELADKKLLANQNRVMDALKPSER